MKTQTINQLYEENRAQLAAAQAASVAAKEFARAANGNRGHVMPAPALYDLLSDLKLTLWDLEEVVRFLPKGLENSFHCPGHPYIGQADYQAAEDEARAAARGVWGTCPA